MIPRCKECQHCELPKVKAGDTVLVTWVKNTPVVVDVVKKS